MVCAIYKFFSNNSTTMLNHVKKTLSVGFCFGPSPRWPMVAVREQAWWQEPTLSCIYLSPAEPIWGPRWH